MPNEEITYSTKIGKSMPIMVTVILGSIALLSFAANAPPAVGIFFCCLIISTWLTYNNSEFAVTNRRVVVKLGVFRQKTFEILLTKIESLQFEQGISQRLFGVGNITIVGSGGTPEIFKNIGNPLEFRKQIQIQIDNVIRK